MSLSLNQNDINLAFDILSHIFRLRLDRRTALKATLRRCAVIPAVTRALTGEGSGFLKPTQHKVIATLLVLCERSTA